MAVVLIPLASYGETVTTTVGVGKNPRSIAVNPATNKVYVANFRGQLGEPTEPNTVTVINGDTAIPITTLLVGTNPSAVAVNPATNKIYVMNQEQIGNSTVSVIDGTTDTVSATIPVQFLPGAIAVNPSTNKVYVANSVSNTVTVIDGVTDIPDPVPVDVGEYPIALAVNPLTNKVYVANQGNGAVNGTVTIVDGATNSTTSVDVGLYPSALAVNQTTNMVYVANSYSDTVTVIDVADNNSTTTVSAGYYPFAVALNQTTNKIYVANQGNGIVNGTVTVIDGATNIAIPVSVGTSPYGVTVNSGTNKVYVPNRGSDDVTVIDGATNTPATLAAVAGQVWDAPRAIAVNPETNKTFVANELSDNVTVIQSFYTVSITRTGTGTGTVASSPDGIACGTACSAMFPEGPVALLSQAPATNSGFSGWGGACSGTGDCAFSMLSDKDVSAVFVLEPLVKNQNTGVAYSVLQDAYDEAKDNHVVSARSSLTAPGLSLNKTTILTIKGGYDADYSSCTGLTTVLGRLNVGLAPLRVLGLAIKAAP